MPGRINPDDKDLVRERSDIVKVVSGYLQLKKNGRDSFVGLCPFHQEKTPSFNVSQSKQVFFCHGCSEGGDVIKFLEKVENLTFAEAVERLAEQAGVRLRYDGQSAADRRVAGHRQALYRANAEAGVLFHTTLLEGKEAAEAREYLTSRGVTKESVEKFAVGYAPGYPDFLLRRLSGSFGPELLAEAGLVARDGQNTLRDRFRGRVTFPIHDVTGNAVGFGGRLLQPKDRPPIQAAKYVNSSDSPVYHKSSLLYNLHRAKGDIGRDRRAFLVEGYTDVIALDQAGVTEVVATSGTALGEEHVRVLSRFTDRLVLAFDSDEAGARAAERAFQFHQQFAVDFLVLVLPQGQDPADFVIARGQEARGRIPGPGRGGRAPGRVHGPAPAVGPGARDARGAIASRARRPGGPDAPGRPRPAAAVRAAGRRPRRRHVGLGVDGARADVGPIHRNRRTAVAREGARDARAAGPAG